MKRVLITGANGFLGSNLVRILLSYNYNILAFSRKNCNLTKYLDLIDFVEMRSDLYTEHIEKIKEFEPDVVMHFAWDGGNNRNDVNDISKQINTNTIAGLSLLQILKELSKKPIFLAAGAFGEYGEIRSPAIETSNLNPTTFYGLSKKMFKEISELFCYQNHICLTWVRPCFVYGPNDVKTRLIPTVIRKLKTHEDIVLDSCNTLIDYIYIDDFCKAVIRLIETKTPGVFNICSGNQYLLKDIILLIQSNIHSNSKITFDESLNSNKSSKYICGSNDKIKSTLNWTPEIDLKTGINFISQER